MAEYKKLLSKYEEINKTNNKIKTNLSIFIKKISKVNIENKSFVIEKDTIKIITNSVYKFELLHHKEEIENEIKNCTKVK